MAFRPSYVVLPPVDISDSESDEGVAEHDSRTTFATSERKYEYRKLGPNEIRLLILNPGLPDEPIECFLEHYSVNQAKKYQALSYAWGNARDVSSIQVDGCPFQVSRNLKNFLVSYRTNNACPVLWIDAVCINQHDILERNAQIRLMKRVYEGADIVLIWLGLEVDATGSAIEQIQHVYHDFWLPRLKREGSAEKVILSITTNDIPEIIGQKQEDGGYKDVHIAWEGIQDLLQRPWWSRIWVYQEATAPAKRGSFVLCGPHRILFDEVLVMNKVVRHLAFSDNSVTEFQKHGSVTGIFMEVYSDLRREYQEKGTSSFLRLADLLPTLRNLAATNPRDKLYALIPTSLDGAELLDVDYGLTVEEVYANAAVSFIQKHRNLDILGHCTKPEKSSQLILPSWVPDWTSTRAPIHFFKRRRRDLSVDTNAHEDKMGEVSGQDGITNLYHASSDRPAEPKVDEASRKLFCKGFQFDVVELFSPSTGEAYGHGSIAKDWVKWLIHNSFPLSQRRGSYPNGDSTRDALSRTLVADCTRIGVDLADRGCSADIEWSAMVDQGGETLHFKDPGGVGVGVLGAHPATFRRRLIVTQKRYLGLTSEHVEAGDIIAILMGGQLPFILRKVHNHYILIGEAYVHGIMDAEAMAESRVTSGSTQDSMTEFEIW